MKILKRIGIAALIVIGLLAALVYLPLVFFPSYLSIRNRSTHPVESIEILITTGTNSPSAHTRIQSLGGLPPGQESSQRIKGGNASMSVAFVFKGQKHVVDCGYVDDILTSFDLIVQDIGPIDCKIPPKESP
ncbi:MAG: hypothetical protein ACXVB8_08945 [Bdellovibrionota bacterium]